MNAAELAKAMIAAKADCDAAFEENRRCILADAEADRKLKVAWARRTWPRTGTVGERAAHCEKATADERYAARLAEGLRRSAYQAVEYRIRCLRMLQSVAAWRRPRPIGKWTPREVESG